MRRFPVLAVAVIGAGLSAFVFSTLIPAEETFWAQPLTAQHIPDEYFTVSSPAPLSTRAVSATVTEQAMNARFSGLLSHVRWLIERQASGAASSGGVSRELLLKQADRIYESSSDNFDSIGETFSTAELTVTGDTTLSGELTVSSLLTIPYLMATSTTGTSTFSGALAVGTTTSQERFTLDGAAYLAAIAVPSVTSDRLYNTGGDLYWAGSIVGGSTVGSWITDGTDVWRAGGNVGIGTTGPGQELEVNGDILLGAATPSLYLGNDSDQYITGNAASNYISISTANDEIARFHSNGGLAFGDDYVATTPPADGLIIEGNVGIGDTTPTSLFTVGNGDLFQVNSSGAIAAST